MEWVTYGENECLAGDISESQFNTQVESLRAAMLSTIVDSHTPSHSFSELSKVGPSRRGRPKHKRC